MDCLMDVQDLILTGKKILTETIVEVNISSIQSAFWLARVN